MALACQDGSAAVAGQALAFRLTELLPVAENAMVNQPADLTVPTLISSVRAVMFASEPLIRPIDR